MSCNADPSSLRSDTELKIPSHVRQYLQKLEAYARDRKRLSELEMQIVALRALGEHSPSYVALSLCKPPYTAPFHCSTCDMVAHSLEMQHLLTQQRS